MVDSNDTGVQDCTTTDSRVLNLPLSVLHLGLKGNAIEKAGYRSVGDLKDISAGSIGQIPAVGRKTVELLQDRLQALLASVKDNGEIDWEHYCAAIQIPLVPALQNPRSGKEFLNSLPRIFAELADHLTDDTLAQILRERLCKPPGKQKTLEQIGEDTQPPVTRERIRQKEQKLFRQLVGGLLYDSYGDFGIHFHPAFSRWWRVAAESLPEVDEIDCKEFVETLATVWQVTPSSIIKQLPILLAVVTGESTMPRDFRSVVRIDAKWFGSFENSVSSVSVMKLRIGKYAEKLSEAGFLSLGDVARGLQSDIIARAVPINFSKLVKHLNMFASCIGDNGTPDWAKYQCSLGLARLPETYPADASQFAQELLDNLMQLLRQCTVTKRSVEIFKLRTCREKDQRMTLHQVAEELNSHQPTIKREETVMLNFLNDVLIARDFSSLPVWLDENWLNFWSEADSIFKVSGRDYHNFTENLSRYWRLTDRMLRGATPAIWAVLTGYPNGRPVRQAMDPDHVDPEVPVGRIRLKGFRKIH